MGKGRASCGSNVHIKKMIICGVADGEDAGELSDGIHVGIDFHHFCGAMAQNMSIEHLIFQDCRIAGDVWLQLLWPFFDNNHNLRILQFCNCHIASSGADNTSIIATTLSRCNKTSLEEIFLEENEIDAKSGQKNHYCTK